MLVLTRKPQQSIMIDNRIGIQVLKVLTDGAELRVTYLTDFEQEEFRATTLGRNSGDTVALLPSGCNPNFVSARELVVTLRTSGDVLLFETAGREKIRLYVTETGGNQARIGIEAPKTVIVHRDEVAEETMRANSDAADGRQLLDALRRPAARS
jgi:sRNA-binding carbon storage regulator CsrA